MLIETLEKRDNMLIEKGLQQGMQQGKISAEEETARRMIIDGIKDIEKIHHWTMLDKDKIKKLIKKYGK